MPFYEYECQKCGHHLEAMQKFSERPLKRCPECGKPALKKLMSSPVFRLKGSGWYETDFKSDTASQRNLADRPEAEDKKEDKKEEKKDETKKEEKKEESKAESSSASAAKPEPKAEAKSDGKSDSKPDSAPKGSAGTASSNKASARRRRPRAGPSDPLQSIDNRRA